MNPEVQVLDGGWAWALVIGVSIINVFNQSILSLFGLLFGPRLEELSNAGGVTLVMSINVTVTNFSGFLINPLSKYLPTKYITQIGILLVSFGLGFSAYMDNYVCIILGYGLSTGLGLGLISSSTFLLINSYFSKRKSQAVGLAMAGTSVGQMSMPPFVALLLNNFGFNTTLYILSGLSLIGLLGSLLFIITEKHGQSEVVTQLYRKSEPSEVSTIDESNRQSNQNEPQQNQTPNKQSFYKRIIDMFDLQILLDPIFVHIMMGLSLSYVSSISFGAIFPLFLKEDLKFKIIDISTCMSVLSTMDLLGRLVVPLLTSAFGIKHRTTFILASLILVICRTVLVLQTRYLLVISVSAICGLARAATIINQNLVIAEYSKKEQVSSALSLNMIAKGITVLIIGSLLGKLKDSAHNFAICIYIVNLIVFLVIASWSFEIGVRKFRQANITFKSTTKG